jgi:ribosome-binding factor A
MTQKPFARNDRMSGQLRRELAVLIRSEVRDPRAAEVSITDVVVSKDLHYADVYFVCPSEHAAEARKGLGSAAPFLRKTLGKLLHVRVVPELRFHYDDSVDKGSEIEQLLQKLR